MDPIPTQLDWFWASLSSRDQQLACRGFIRVFFMQAELPVLSASFPLLFLANGILDRDKSLASGVKHMCGSCKGSQQERALTFPCLPNMQHHSPATQQHLCPGKYPHSPSSPAWFSRWKISRTNAIFPNGSCRSQVTGEDLLSRPRLQSWRYTPKRASQAACPGLLNTVLTS